jgi:3,4-dihydroxy 2-butanone 4-phosphate synthase/GTP cyclohydrolase II
MFFPAGFESAAPLAERLSALPAGAPRESAAAAATALAAGGVVIVAVGGAHGEKGGGFFLAAAALAAPETVNTTILWGRGLTCFSVTAERAMALGLVLAGEYRDGYQGPILLRSVEAASCEGTGISAADRALTLRAAGAPESGIASLKSPGHVMPAMIGYRGRVHRASADIALDLLRALTRYDVAAWTDILDDSGELAPAAYCTDLAGQLGLPCLDLLAVFGEHALG